MKFAIIIFISHITCFICSYCTRKSSKKIASKGSCVIVGRAADYVLRDNKNIVRIFIYANKNYRAKKVMEMYGDAKEEAYKNISRSDKNRAGYYKIVSSQKWGNVENYDLCIDSSIGIDKTSQTIVDYISKVK